jgi:transcriptional regulator with XRE-family HTH domain
MEEYVIAERVRKAREWRGWSQTELARRAEIHPVVLNRLEKKHKAGVQAETIRRLAMALRVSADYLLGITKTLGGAHETEDLSATPPIQPKRRRTRQAATVA